MLFHIFIMSNVWWVYVCLLFSSTSNIQIFVIIHYEINFAGVSECLLQVNILVSNLIVL